MATLNLPFGNQAYPDGPFTGNAAGIRTAMGLLVPGVGQVVAFVRATPMLGNVPPEVETKRKTSIKDALKLCRPGMGDTVVVLPGHTEIDLDGSLLVNLVEGSRIIGMGVPDQDDSPTITLNAAAASLAITKKNVTIANMRILCDGFNGVTNAINVTAAGFKLLGNLIRVANGAALKATTVFTVGAGAHQCSIKGNRFIGTATHNVTSCIIAGVNAILDLAVEDNEFQLSSSNGIVQVAGTLLRISIARNKIYNTQTASTAAITVNNVICDGVICDNYCSVLANGTINGISLGAAALVKCFQNFACDEPIKSGALSPAAAT